MRFALRLLVKHANVYVKISYREQGQTRRSAFQRFASWDFFNSNVYTNVFSVAASKQTTLIQNAEPMRQRGLRANYDKARKCVSL